MGYVIEILICESSDILSKVYNTSSCFPGSRCARGSVEFCLQTGRECTSAQLLEEEDVANPQATLGSC